MNGKSHTLNVENFRDMLHICPRLPGQRFEDPPHEEEILSFIRDLGHIGEIKVLTDVNVNYMHRPWRSFAAIINKCLSGKTTGLDSLRLSHLVYQVENKNLKKNNDMCYLRFTKVIIDYFMSKDQSISRRNMMFWHTFIDDPIFNTIRVISRHQDTHVYGAILSAALTNQEMLDSKAYKEYYAVASRAEPPKAQTKYKKKADESVTSPKSKTASASKGTRLKSKVKITNPDMMKQPVKKTKAKDLAVLSKDALSEAKQIKLVTKGSKTDFHISQASGSGDGVNTQLKVPDEQQQKTSGTDEGTSTIPGVPDVPPYESKSESDDHNDEGDDERTESDGDEIPDLNLTNVDQTEYKEEDVDERVRTPFDYQLTKEEKFNNEETMDDEEDDEVIKELHNDVNANLGNDDIKMTDDDQRGSQQQNDFQESGFSQEEEDVHVTLTPVPVTQKADKTVQSSFVSFKFTSKFLNLKNPSPTDNEIASLMETSVPHATAISEITTGFTTTTLLPPSGQDDQDKDEDPSAGSDRGMKRRKSGKDAASSKDSRRRIIAVTRLSIMKKYDYGYLEEIETYCHSKAGGRFLIRCRKLPKKLNLTKPDTFKSNLQNKTTYISLSDPHGIIYVNSFKRKRLMRIDKLHKFSDGTLNDVRTSLHDIAAGIRMDYLPMRRWSNLDKKRARVMVQEIDKQLYQRRLMQNLEKFVGKRPYGQDLRYLLSSTKSYKSYAPPSKQSSSTRSNASTNYKGKEIAKPITPPFELASKEDSDPEQAQRDQDMQKNLALIAKYFKKIYKPTNNNLITFSNSRKKNVDTSQKYKNDNMTGQFGNQRTVTVVGARETASSQAV
uniref:Uncharacterized protein n=1 Tax=Tanacetum cinerariifolium TaxID=118510 RepID=A0A6L2NIK6_TANCI|nr:hypothetical protein [Tanacetum cinerariifolium]